MITPFRIAMSYYSAMEFSALRSGFKAQAERSDACAFYLQSKHQTFLSMLIPMLKQ